MRLAIAIILGFATFCVSMDDCYQHWRVSKIVDATLHFNQTWAHVDDNRGTTFVVSASCMSVLKDTDLKTFLKDAR